MYILLNFEAPGARIKVIVKICENLVALLSTDEEKLPEMALSNFENFQNKRHPNRRTSWQLKVN